MTATKVPCAPPAPGSPEIFAVRRGNFRARSPLDLPETFRLASAQATDVATPSNSYDVLVRLRGVVLP